MKDNIIVGFTIREDELRNSGPDTVVGDCQGFGVRVDVDARAIGWLNASGESAGDEIGGVRVEVEERLC